MLHSLQEYTSCWRGEVVVATFLCILISRHLRCRRDNDIPSATDSVPILGHALAYKQDPATFLSSQSCGVFRINLAGRHMIVVSDARAMKQIANMPEKSMSARQAVADVGFEYTLGLRNVHKGTDWHKRILKDWVYSNTNDALSTIFQFMVKAFDHETNNDDTIIVDDLFVFMRRCMLRAMLMYMIAPIILDGENAKFLDDFMEYQDLVEDSTAKAAVLPRFLTVPLVLRPVRQRREELTLQLADMINTIWKNNQSEHGPWLTAFQEEHISAEEAAELTIGLMFAAHKNPAIGVSQSFCFLQTEATPEQQQSGRSEAKRMYDSYCTGMTPTESPTLRHCVLETLRLTAHSIGGIRTAQKEFVLETSNGVTHSIQKGDVIAISHVSTHRDPCIWGDDACDFGKIDGTIQKQ